MKKLILLTAIVFISFVNYNIQSQWVQVSNGIQNRDIRCMVSSGTYIFCSATNYNGIYYSSNNGVNWSLRGLSTRMVYSLAGNDNYIYAGLDTEVCRSSDLGLTWTFTGIPNAGQVGSIAVSGNNMMLSAQNLDVAFIYYSSDAGNTWNYSFGLSGVGSRLGVNQNHFYAGSCSPPFFFKHTSDYGQNWLSTGMIWPIGRTSCIGANSNYVFAGTSKYTYYDTTIAGGFCLSSDNGSSWLVKGLTQKSVYAMTVYGNNIIAGTQDSGIYVSTNNGFNWMKKSEGLPAVNTTNTLYIFNGYIYAGIQNQSAWRRPLAEIINDASPVSSEIPASFKLYQNYPNPFNPTTNIKYQIADNKFVTLKIYDLLGKEAATLLNKKQSPGRYEITWNGSSYPSGVYYYSLYADGQRIDTKKMVLVK